MRKGNLAAAFVVSLFISTGAWAAEYVFDVKATESQTGRFFDGREAVDSAMLKSTVRIVEPRQQTPKQSGFRVYVSNNGGQPFNFGPEHITIIMSDGSRVAMLTYNELMKQQKRREAWQAFAMGLSAAGRNMQANQAGYSYGTTAYSGNTYGTFGNTPYSANSTGFGTYSGYNASAAYAAQATANEQNQRDMQILQMNQAAQRADIAEVMKMTTVDPGQVFGGIVQYKVPSAVRSSKEAVPITIEIKAGDETHIFQATLEKYRG